MLLTRALFAAKYCIKSICVDLTARAIPYFGPKMEPGSRTSTVDKLAHFVHQLKTVSPLSSNFNAILTHLRDYLKRHPPQVAGFVHGGGIPVVMKILSRPLPPSPSPQMSESTLNSGSNGDGPSPEATVLLEKALALLNVVSVEESGRRQLSNEGSLRIFCTSCQYQSLMLEILVTILGEVQEKSC